VGAGVINFIKRYPVTLREWAIFIALNAILIGIISRLDDPLPFFMLGTFGIIPFLYFNKINGFFEILVLILFISLIEKLNLSIGIEALTAGILLLFLLNLVRSFIEGFDGWRQVQFRKELILFNGIAFASLFSGLIVLNGLRMFVINCVFGIFVFLITHHTCKSFLRIQYLTLFLMLFFLINGLYGIFDFAQNQGRAVCLSIDTPTYSGHLFAEGIAISIGALFSPFFKKYRTWIFLSILVLITALFLTFTRAAYLSMGILIGLVVFFTRIPKRYIISGILGIGVFLIFVFIYFKSNAVLFMIKQRMDMDVRNANLSVGSIAFRFLLWKSAWEMFLQHPLLGIGFDNFVKVNASTSLFPIIKGLGGANLYAHNVYLQFLAEMGIPGLASFIWLIWRVFMKISTLLKKLSNNEYRFLLLGYAGGFVLWLFMALTEAAFYTPMTALLFFFYLGIFSGFTNLILNRTAE
jgi:O-antigen ligase